MGFEKNKAKSDEWYTPADAIYPILKYIRPNSVIWCPFDKEESLFVKILRKEGHSVFCTHIEKGQDFLQIDLSNACNYIISNPPFSLRQKVLIKLFDMQKPFMMLMNTNGIFDSKTRWNLFKNNNFSIIYLEGRVKYNGGDGKGTTLSPPFQSAYVCSQISDNKIMFEDRGK